MTVEFDDSHHLNESEAPPGLWQNPFARTAHPTTLDPTPLPYHRDLCDSDLMGPSSTSNGHSTHFATGLASIHAPNSWTGMEKDAAERVDRLQTLLAKSLGPEYLSQRKGGGGASLTYIEGWRAINLANEIFGFNGWYSEIKSIDTDFADYNPQSDRWNIGVSAIIRVWLSDGSSHEDVGYGHFENTKSKGDGFQKAKKEAVTDALKRTLRNFGSLLGNCLYDKQYCSHALKMAKKIPPVDFTQIYRPNNDAPQAFASTTTKYPPGISADSSKPLVASTSNLKPQIPVTGPPPRVTNANQSHSGPVARAAPPQLQQVRKMNPPAAPPRQAPTRPAVAPVEPLLPLEAPGSDLFAGEEDEALFDSLDIQMDGSVSMQHEEKLGDDDSGFAENDSFRVGYEAVPDFLPAGLPSKTLSSADERAIQLKLQEAQQRQAAQRLQAQQQQNRAAHTPILNRANTVHTSTGGSRASGSGTTTAAQMLAGSKGAPSAATMTTPKGGLRPAQAPLSRAQSLANPRPQPPVQHTPVNPNISRPIQRSAVTPITVAGRLPALNVGGAGARLGGVAGVVGEGDSTGFMSARGIKRSLDVYEPTPPTPAATNAANQTSPSRYQQVGISPNGKRQPLGELDIGGSAEGKRLRSE